MDNKQKAKAKNAKHSKTSRKIAIVLEGFIALQGTGASVSNCKKEWGKKANFKIYHGEICQQPVALLYKEDGLSLRYTASAKQLRLEVSVGKLKEPSTVPQQGQIQP